MEGSRPGVPKSDGSTAVNPSSASRRPNAATFGLMPGISVITMIPGPEPIRNIGYVRPSAVNDKRSNPSNGSESGMGGHPTVRLVPSAQYAWVRWRSR